MARKRFTAEQIVIKLREAPGFYPAVEAGKQWNVPASVASTFLSAGPTLTDMTPTAG